MPDAFNDATKLTKSHIPATNAPVRIDVHNRQCNVPTNDSSVAHLKRGRPLGLKDSVSQKRKSMAKMNPNEKNREPTIHNSNTLEKAQVLPKKENVLGETSAPEVATVTKWVFTRKGNEKNEIARFSTGASGILVHQSTYTEKVLKRYGMDKVLPLSTPMVVRSLDTKNDPYRPKGDDEMDLDTALLQQADIGPASNIFYDIFVGQKMWAYSIPVNRPMPRVLLDMLMQDTSLIHIKDAHKLGMLLHIEELQSHGAQGNKHW
ncbi:unnamed protein product [Prunus armeniaca]